MKPLNHTLVTHFILVGFSQNFQICILLFAIFSAIYILTILGNGFLIFTVIVSPKLHTPMYYFLCNLSFLDLCVSSCCIPKLLVDLFSKNKRISLIGCLTQMCTASFLGATECVLLAVMAYDRYIAICYPLYYTVIMSWRVCRYITVFMWFGNFMFISVLAITSPLVFCKENHLNHFICEVLVVLEVACGDITVYRMGIFVIGTLTIILSPAFIVISYFCIIISILQIHSSGGRSKAFSTCASHLTVVVIYFGTYMIMYMGQSIISTSNLRYISLIYGILTPIINPFIYSLRNNDVNKAFCKILTKCSTTHRKLYFNQQVPRLCCIL